MNRTNFTVEQWAELADVLMDAHWGNHRLQQRLKQKIADAKADAADEEAHEDELASIANDPMKADY